MKSLLLNSLILCLAASCSSAYKGHGERPETGDGPPRSWFRQDTSVAMFTTSIDLMKRHFSGLIVIKPLPDDAYRVVFVTELGLKVFDFEYRQDQIIVHYLMETMKRARGILSQDINLVLIRGLHSYQPSLMIEKTTGNRILKYRIDGRHYYYHVDENGNTIKVFQKGSLLKKVKADFYGSQNGHVDSIAVEHYNMNWVMRMYYLNDTANHADEQALHNRTL